MTKIKIPLAMPSFDEREVEAVRRVLSSGWVIQGPEVEGFEKAIAELHQAHYCIAVSSGTAALHLCYLALGIGPGDAVFLPSFAWPSAANMAMVVGARPVFVDVLPDTYNINPADLEIKIHEFIKQKRGRPRAIVPVHEFGLAADMNSILKISKKYRMDVIEDAACALGATYKGKPVGSLGRMGIFSFHPRKAITTGEGGAIITNDTGLAERCRMWRNHGQVFKNGGRDFQVAGLNYRMTEIQAAIGRIQLAKFPKILKKRRQIALQYLREFSECPAITLPSNHPEHTWQTFMIVIEKGRDRSFIINKLTTKGYGVNLGAIAGHCEWIYREHFGYQASDLPISDNLASQGLALPLYSGLTDRKISMITNELRKISKS